MEGITKFFVYNYYKLIIIVYIYSKRIDTGHFQMLRPELVNLQELQRIINIY